MLNHPGYPIALDESGDFTNIKESLVAPYHTKVVILKTEQKFPTVKKQNFHRGIAGKLPKVKKCNAVQLSFDSKRAATFVLTI